MGDIYDGGVPRNGIPWRVALAADSSQAEGKDSIFGYPACVFGGGGLVPLSFVLSVLERPRIHYVKLPGDFIGGYAVDSDLA